MSDVKNGLSVDFEDWHQPFAARSISEWKNFESRVPQDTERILGLFERLNVRATFFVLGEVAELFPDCIRAIHRAGHEIASHGYRHLPLSEQERCLFDLELRGSLEFLGELTGEPVLGFRAPFFSLGPDTLWAVESLKRLGLKYSSSIHPTVSLFHGFRSAPQQPFDHPNGLREFPITTLPLPGIPIPFGGGLYYRLLPYAAIRCGLRWLNRRNRPSVVYFHPRELDASLPRLRVGPTLDLIVYTGVDSFESKLVRLIQDFRFVPLRELSPW